jgi:hypothetical protein
VHQLQSLRRYLDVPLRDSGEIASGLVQTGDKSELDRIAAGRKYNRDRAPGGFRGGRRGRTGRGNHVYLAPDQPINDRG